MNDKQKIVKSSIIRAYEYDADKYVLSVTFMSGKTYTYKQIDPSLMSSVFDGPNSIGKAFSRLIKDKHKGIESND